MKFYYLSALLVSILFSCANDNKEDLKPTAPTPQEKEISFSAQVQPILTASCTKCHGTSGGVTLTTFEGVKASALSGELVGSIKHASGFSPMPKNSAKLSNSQIQEIELWVKQGAKNN